MHRVKHFMEQAGIRAAELARRTGIHPSRFSRWFEGKGEPSLEQYRLIAIALDVSIDEIAGITERRPGLTEDEKVLLKMVKALGTEEAMRRLMHTPGSGIVFKKPARPD